MSSDRLNLTRKENEKDLFEAGCCDKFSKKLPNIGKLTRIKIGHDNSGSFPGWHLDKVNHFDCLY